MDNDKHNIAAVTPGANESLEEAIQYAKKYIEDLISFFGLNTDVYATANEDEVIELHVPSTRLNGFLIGQRGDTMYSMQSLTSSALRQQGFSHSRVFIDVAEYKKQRADRLAEKAKKWMDSAHETGEDYHVRPMSAADRRVVHQVAADNGLTTESIGDGRERHVVIKAGKKTEE